MFYPTTCVRLRYGCRRDTFSGFSREHAYTRYCRLPEDWAYYQVRLGRRACLPPSAPTPFNGLIRQPAALSLFRPRVTRAGSSGILTGSAIGSAFRLCLRARLTLIRLALIRKPWSCGERVSRPLCRYLYLHLLFQTLQRRSRGAFCADWNAPLPTTGFHGFGSALMPDYYPCRTPRLVSCYALFK